MGIIAIVAVIGFMAAVANAQQTPYPGPGAHPIPGTIEAENYDSGGEGVAYSDTTPGNAGGQYRTDDVDIFALTASGLSTAEALYVDMDATGEWTEYTVDVAASGLYKVEVFYVVTTTGKTLTLSMDGAPIYSTITLPSAGTSKWCISAFVCPLTQGNGRIFRLDSGTGGVRISWVRFTAYSDGNIRANALWRFDYDAGGPTVQDQTANGNNGTGTGLTYSNEIPSPAPGAGTTTPNFTVHDGLWNTTSAEFVRAESDCVVVPDSDSLDMGAGKSFFIEAFVKVTTEGAAADPTTRQWLLQKKANAADSATDYAVMINGADLTANPTWTNLTAAGVGNEVVLMFGRSDLAAAETVVSTRTISADGGWHHLMVSYDAAKHEVIFIVDNVPDRVQNVYPTNVSNDGPLYIGCHVNSAGTKNQFFDGKIDELRIEGALLAGTPTGTGPFLNTWFWENNGTILNGMYTLDGKAPWSYRRSKILVTNTCFWKVEECAECADNQAIRFFDGADYNNYFFYDEADLGANRADCSPTNKAAGVTLQMRFKMTDFARYEIPSTSQAKWLGIRLQLAGEATAGAKLNWQVTYTDEANRTGISIQAEENNVDTNADGVYDAKWTSSNLDDGNYHVLHAIAYVSAPGEVRHQTWLDGVLVEDWIKKSFSANVQFAWNDNGNRFLSEYLVDYVRIAAGAWDVNNNLITPMPEVCNNGFDDDMDGLTDCADDDCSGGATGQPNPLCCTADPVFDTDGDGDVDQVDFASFQACFGKAWAVLPVECRCMDKGAHQNTGIDTDDYDAFELCASGAGIAANAACD